LKFILDNMYNICLAELVRNKLVVLFLLFFVPKIDVRIGMEQELERVAVKNFCMAPPAMWVLVYSLGCPVAQGEISRFGQP
jgi:glucose-6-phosphate-specific signal transduction histidine kinase